MSSLRSLPTKAPTRRQMAHIRAVEREVFLAGYDIENVTLDARSPEEAAERVLPLIGRYASVPGRRSAFMWEP